MWPGTTEMLGYKIFSQIRRVQCRNRIDVFFASSLRVIGGTSTRRQNLERWLQTQPSSVRMLLDVEGRRSILP